MFNYQTFLQQQNMQKHISNIRQELELAEMKRQKSSAELVHAHKKRIEGFILSSIDKPISVSQYKNELPSFRNTNEVRNLGSKGFYLKRQTQVQRIEKQLKINGQLDHIPFNNASSHQFRQFHGQGLHFQPFTHSLRVKEYLDRQQLNYLSNSAPKLDRLLKKNKEGQEFNFERLNLINKSLLPELHAKTYFKSVSTLFADIPTRKKQIDRTIKEQDLEQMQQRRPTKESQNAMKQNSREALLKCNMLKQKLRG